MSWPFLFRKGWSYIAGFDRPTIVSLDTLSEKVEAKGFRVLWIAPCDEVPGMPFQTPGTCGDEWDYYGFVKRTGKTKTIDVPDRVQWIRAVPPLLPPETKPNGAKPPPAPVPCTTVRVPPMTGDVSSGGGHVAVALGSGMGLAAGIGVALLGRFAGRALFGAVGATVGTIAGAWYARRNLM